MASCTVNKCCCCIDLRTGCLILGYLNLVAMLILTGITLLSVLAVNVINATTENKDQEAKEMAQGIAYIMNIVAIVLLPFLILGLAMTIVLLVGLHNNKPGHVKAYLIFNVILIVVLILEFIVTMAKAATIQTALHGILQIAISIYFLIVIKSYYHKMREERNSGPAIYKV